MTSRLSRLAACVVLMVLVALPLACAPNPQPVDFEAPWQDGEVTRYNITTTDGTLVGAATWSVRHQENRWVLVQHNAVGEVEGEMVVDEKLRPVTGWRKQGGLRADTTYSPHDISIVKTPEDGAKTTETIPRPEGALDNEQTLQTFRALPFAPGMEVAFANISAAGGVIPFTVNLAGEEQVEVPAGNFDTWHLHVHFASIRHEAWYSKHAPHVLVRYRNPTAGKTFELRSWRASEAAENRGTVDPPPVPPMGSVPLSWSLAAVMGLLQVPLMIGLPLALGLVLKRKLKVGWKLWMAGAVAFVASQVVHLPLNWAIGLLGAPRGAGLLPLPWMALVAGLSAGVCEEVARYVALGVVLRKIRHSWDEAIQYGAGHGGVESIILGGFVGVNLVAMIVLELQPTALGLQGEALAQTLAASDSFWRTPWPMSVAGGLERVFAIASHIGMSVLVMRAIACRKTTYLFAAILAHAALDAAAVMSAARLGTWPTEGIVAGFAVGLLALTLALRKARWPENVEDTLRPKDASA